MRQAAFWAFLLLLAHRPDAFAERLPLTVIPDHYDLAFDVDLDRARFDGTETIRVRVGASTSQIVLHAAEITFREVTIATVAGRQRARVTLDQNAQTATLTIPRAIAPGTADIHIRYSGVLNDDLRGFYLSRANGRRYAVTQLEATDARRAFPSFDEPAFKATFAVAMTVPRGDTAISNGALLSDTPGPRPSRHTLKFATSPKMSTYLVALAVGDFECLEGRADGVPIRVCATRGQRDLGRIALDAAEFILRYYNAYYSRPYPFGKLDLLAVPDFAAGAMENTGAIFFRDTELLLDPRTTSVAAIKGVAETVAHEIAHQWFGNLVTMRWWDDLWLNEGFATWMQTRPLAAWKPDWPITVDEALATERALNLDSLASTRPIRSPVETPAEIEESFDAIAYEKGAAVLRMVESYVGADAFRKGVNAYLEEHAYGNATSEDFWSAMAKASGKPVDRMLPTFVTQPGVPLISASLACSDRRGEVRLQQRRFYLDPALMKTSVPGTWTIPVCAKLSELGAPSCELFQSGTPPLSVGEDSCPAWSFLNSNARGYYRTAYSPELLRSLTAAASSSLSPSERLSLVSDEWALVLAGQHNANEFLNLSAGFGNEDTSGVLNRIVAGLTFAHDYLTTPATRGPFEGFVRSLLARRFAELGITPRSGESDQRRELRAVVVAALGSLGHDADLIAQARTATEQALTGGTPLDPTAADAIVSVAASRGNAALWEALAAAAQRASSSEEQYRYLYALGDFEDAALVQRGLEYSLTDAVRAQNAGRYLARFLSNPDINGRAWTFVKEHWKDLEPKISVAFSDVRIVQALGSFCDATARDDIRSFFATHRLGSASRTVDQTLERIDNCVAIRAPQTESVTRWLMSR